MADEDESAQRCSGCGAAIAGGDAGCEAAFREILARDFSDARFFRAHRLMVDAYALQHPDRYGASAKSLAAHLLGVGWSLERGGGDTVPGKAIRRWLDGNPGLERLEPPPARGTRTIAEARAATDPEAYARAVRDWARAVWAAYARSHAVAREWMDRAVAASARRRPASRSRIRRGRS